MNQYDLPLDEQVSDLTPEMQAVHRRIMVRQRIKVGSKSRYLFEQMRREVDAAPEPQQKDTQ